MIIHVIFKDPAELSVRPRRDESIEEEDLAQEKVLRVNPQCYIRIMLEYIRKSCKLAANTFFDLCDESGKLLNLFNYPNFAYVQEFESRKNYYLVVINYCQRASTYFEQIAIRAGLADKEKTAVQLRQESPDNAAAGIFVQLNHQNKLNTDLTEKVTKYIEDAEENFEKENKELEKQKARDIESKGFSKASPPAKAVSKKKDK